MRSRGACQFSLASPCAHEGNAHGCSLAYLYPLPHHTLRLRRRASTTSKAGLWSSPGALSPTHTITVCFPYHLSLCDDSALGTTPWCYLFCSFFLIPINPNTKASTHAPNICSLLKGDSRALPPPSHPTNPRSALGAARPRVAGQAHQQKVQAEVGRRRHDDVCMSGACP